MLVRILHGPYKKSCYMKPIERFKNLIKLDKKDIYQIVLYSIFGGLISLSLPLGIQSIVNLIQAGKISTSWYGRKLTKNAAS